MVDFVPVSRKKNVAVDAISIELLGLFPQT